MDYQYYQSQKQIQETGQTIPLQQMHFDENAGKGASDQSKQSKLRGPNIPPRNGSRGGGVRPKQLHVGDSKDSAFGYAKREKDGMNSGRDPLSIAGQNSDSIAMNGMAINRNKYISSNGTGLTPANRSGLGSSSRLSGNQISGSRPDMLSTGEQPKTSFFGMGAGRGATQPNKPPLFNNRQIQNRIPPAKKQNVLAPQNQARHASLGGGMRNTGLNLGGGIGGNSIENNIRNNLLAPNALKSSFQQSAEKPMTTPNDMHNLNAPQFSGSGWKKADQKVEQNKKLNSQRINSAKGTGSVRGGSASGMRKGSSQNSDILGIQRQQTQQSNQGYNTQSAKHVQFEGSKQNVPSDNQNELDLKTIQEYQNKMKKKQTGIAAGPMPMNIQGQINSGSSNNYSQMLNEYEQNQGVPPDIEAMGYSDYLLKLGGPTVNGRKKTMPSYCGIYASNQQSNPHVKAAAKSFRKDIFSKLRQVGQNAQSEIGK